MSMPSFFHARPAIAGRAFTLIELLIVVAIVAILAAIAVPNFLEAQTRSKVARVKSEFRTMATGLESYRVDHNAYPIATWGCPGPLSRPVETIEGQRVWGTLPVSMTTPVAYLSLIPRDLFDAGRSRATGQRFYGYGSVDTVEVYQTVGRLPCPALDNPFLLYVLNNPDAAMDLEKYFGAYYLWSVGPQGYGSGSPVNYFMLYDPTNGTVSAGRLVRSQREESPLYIPPNALQ